MANFSLLIYIIISKIPFFFSHTLIHLLAGWCTPWHQTNSKRKWTKKKNDLTAKQEESVRRKWNNLSNHKEQFTFHSVEEKISHLYMLLIIAMEYSYNTVLNTWSYEIQTVMKEWKVFSRFFFGEQNKEKWNFCEQLTKKIY